MEMAIRASKQEILDNYGTLELNFVRERHGIFWYANTIQKFFPVAEPALEFTASIGYPLTPKVTVRYFIEEGENISIIKKDTGAFLYVQTRS